MFYGHLVHFTVFCYILWKFSIVRGNLAYFSRFGILYQEKSGNPDPYKSSCFISRAVGTKHRSRWRVRHRCCKDPAWHHNIPTDPSSMILILTRLVVEHFRKLLTVALEEK
jgi:hypothetical protein